MAIGLKLKELIDHRNTNVNQLAKDARVKPQTIYGIIRRDNTKVDIEILQSLADELAVTLDYFSTGKSSELSLDEQELLTSYRKLDAYGQMAIKTFVGVELGRHERFRENKKKLV
jgi:DNA-binding helix-turn-helix protein